VWSEAETKFLIQVEEELQGTKNINIANDEILKSKTAKQISNKRNTLFIRAKTTKEYTPPPPIGNPTSGNVKGCNMCQWRGKC
jgi:hypothetical protein